MQSLVRPGTLANRMVASMLLVTFGATSFPKVGVAQSAVGSSPAAKPVELPDAFKEDWVPPAPVLTPKNIQLNKAVKIGAPDLKLPQGRALSHDEIRNARVLDTPLLRTGGGQALEAERAALSELLVKHTEGKGLEDHRSAANLKAFVAKHPSSGYATTLLIEAAETEWRHGFFMDGLDTLQSAWDGAKKFTEVNERRLAEMALGRLMERRALLGQKEELRALLAEVKNREMGGYAQDARLRAREVMWFLDNKAERNVFCGFTAANAICVPKGEKPIFPDVHDEGEKKTFIKDGLSGYELMSHSWEAGGSLQVVKRQSGNVIMVPSVIHWKFNHYSAITEEKDGKYRITDEHMRFDSWVPKEAIEAQMSGYFLVPEEAGLAKGYVDVSHEEAKTFYGRHCSHARDSEGCQDSAGGNEDDCPMATYSFRAMDPGLLVKDTPISHNPPYGLPVDFTVSYDQRSVVIADLQARGNLGPRWSHTFQEVIALAGTGTPNTQVKWIQAGGSYFQYTYNSSTQTYGQKFKERPQLVYLDALNGGPGYQLNFRDGSRKVFTQPNSGTPTQFLLTQIVDPIGNALTLQYDGSLRLTTITDALGQDTTIDYTPEVGDNVSGDTLKIRKVTDPFSRIAKFKYTTSGQLQKIIDPIGIVSEFRYAAGDFIDQLTTPYGTTEFTFGELPGINSETGRFIEAKDSQGDRERMEASDFALPDTYVANPEAPTTVNVNGTNVSFMPKVDNLFYRNSFYWNKQQMHYWPGDHSKCRIYNWLASTGDTITSALGSIKEPLVGRVWFNYPGQSSSHVIGNMASPSKVVRAVESTTGTTAWAMSRATYNDLGFPTGNIDPQGREMKYEYYSNNQDIQYVKVKNGANWETLTTISQYKTVSGQSVHLPEIITDVSGLQTQITYNSKGQVTQVTVSKGGNSETTKYIYDSNLDGTADADGYLIRVEHTSPFNPSLFVVLQEATYDSAKRIRTVTDADGYTLTYDYDNLDRVTLVTCPDNTTEQYVYTDGAKQTLDVWAVKDRAGRWNRMRYNSERQLIMQLDPLLRLAQFEWCRCGHPRKLIDPMGKVTWWKRDAQGRVIEKLLSDGKKYLFTYEPLSGRLATVAYPKDVLASQVTFTNRYHLNGQLQEKDYTDAGMADVTVSAADFMGRSTGMIDGTGTYTPSYVSLAGTPDGAGQLATMNGPLADDTLRYTYDWQGRKVKNEIVADDGVTVTRSEESSLDSLGRVTQLVNNLGTFAATFNSGNLSSMPDSVALPGGFSSLYGRYAANGGANALRVQTIHHKHGTNTVKKHDYAYDLTGNITNWDRTNGTGNVTTWSLRYDAANRLVELEEELDAVAQGKEAWHYDFADNLESSMNVPAGQTGTLQIRSHTGRNQLTQMGGTGKTTVGGTINEAGTITVNGEAAKVSKIGSSGPWRFEREMSFSSGSNAIVVQATDGASNVTTQNYSVSVSSTPDETLTYDANGNLIQIADSSSVVTRLCEWDVENSLLAVQSASALATGVKRTEFAYDSGGRRVRQIEKEHNGTAWAVQSDWTFVWNGMELIQKRDTATQDVLMNYFEDGEQQGSEEIVYQQDHLGSVRQWYRVSDGVQGEADFDAWGVRTVNTVGPGVPERGYTGHIHHAMSGLIMAPFRMYDPALGRWLSEDPIGEAGGINLYGYAGNGPTMSIDPLGLDWVDSLPDWVTSAAAALPTIPQPVVDFTAGMGDTLSFGLTNKLRDAMGTNDMVNKCSKSYGAGEWTGTGVGLAMGGAHLGRNAIAQMGKQGTLMQRMARGVSRLAYDNRTWGSVRSTWSRAMGGLANRGQSLHHWAIPQRAGLGRGIMNAGWNYMAISARFNSWMNGTTTLRNLAEWGFKGAVLAIEGAPLTHALSGSNCN